MAHGDPGDAEPAQGGAILRLGFNPPEERVPGFEIIDLATLHQRRRRRGRPADLVHRVDFHTLTLITEGSGEHAIDFITYPCRPGTLLWARPGQVQRFVWPGTANGTHLLFTPAFPPQSSSADRLVKEWYGPGCWQLGAGPQFAVLSTLLGQLRAEYDRPEQTVSREILQLLLATLLLQVDRLPHPAGSGDPRAGGEVYARFRAELERSYAVTRRAADYAHRLGYTVKTLTRACMAATGQPVKHVIDGRVALEAQRLLAHTDEPVATISRRLGFLEPTNFGKFFTRHTGVTPAPSGWTTRGCSEPVTGHAVPTNRVLGQRASSAGMGTGREGRQDCGRPCGDLDAGPRPGAGTDNGRCHPSGELTVSASRVHVKNIRRYFLMPQPVENRDRFAEDFACSATQCGTCCPVSLTAVRRLWLGTPPAPSCRAYAVSAVNF